MIHPSIMLFTSALLVGCAQIDNGIALQNDVNEAANTDASHKVSTEKIGSLHPALVVSTKQSKQQLSDAMKGLLGQYVPMLDTVYTRSSRLQLENNHSDPLGQLGLNGSLPDENAPNLVINLMTDEQHCYLVHQASLRLIKVSGLACTKQ